MGRGALVLVFVLALVAAGCVESTAPKAGVKKLRSPSSTGSLVPDPIELICTIVDEEGKGLKGAMCHFDLDLFTADVPVADDGRASFNVARNATGTVSATAPGRVDKAAFVRAAEPTAARFVLEPRDPKSPLVRAASAPSRTWTQGVTVNTGLVEAQLVLDSKGTIYYTPGMNLYRSLDGGVTWKDITPTVPSTSPPMLASDSAVFVAKDDSVWFTRWINYFLPAIGCTSTTRGDAWTCDSTGTVAASDRQWIAALDATHGYLHSTSALLTRTWSKTDTGSTKYVPISYGSGGAIGNMEVDRSTGAVYQVEWAGNLGLFRVDQIAPANPTSTKTDVPGTQAIAWLRITPEGTMWTTGEPRTGDDAGSRTILAARSRDHGKTWDKFPVTTMPITSTFSYVAPGPDGRVAVAYYGTDKAGLASRTVADWALFVATTDNGNDPHPTWVESKIDPLVHHGVVCIGVGCGESVGDTHGRFALDMIGAWMDNTGNVHVAYSDDAEPGAGGAYLNRGVFLRQVLT
jgi:hypothetical protein